MPPPQGGDKLGFLQGRGGWEGQEKTDSERGAACHSSSKGQQAWLKSARHRSPDPCLICVCMCVCFTLTTVAHLWASLQGLRMCHINHRPVSKSGELGSLTVCVCLCVCVCVCVCVGVWVCVCVCVCLCVHTSVGRKRCVFRRRGMEGQRV